MPEVDRLIVDITVRPAVSEDADGIARIFMESAEFHAQMDPERYLVPPMEPIVARYRSGLQHSADGEGKSVTLVALLGTEVVGFLDARLAQSPDPMHRRVVYCHVSEIAVTGRYRSQGIGERLLRAAEDWGRERGADYASLEYHVANARASAFYRERMGYAAAATIAIKRL